MIDILKEQLDDFKKHVLDFDTYMHTIEVIELVTHWYKTTTIKTINIPNEYWHICQWILDTRKMYAEKNLTLNNLILKGIFKNTVAFYYFITPVDSMPLSMPRPGL